MNLKSLLTHRIKGFDSKCGRAAHLKNLKFLADWNGFIAGHDEHLMRIDSPADLERVKTSGKLRMRRMP